MTENHSTESIITRLDRPITLIGLMGAGKSTLGAAIANALAWEFYDSDQVMEASTGKTVPQIFETQGEAAFRELEKETIAQLLSGHPRSVIATGGGCITIPETASMIFDQSLSIWIHASIDMLVERTSRRKNRPLLKSGDSKEILSNLLEKRGGIYKRAQIHVETEEIPVATMAERALRQIEDYLVQKNP